MPVWDSNKATITKMQHRDTRIDALETQVLHLSYQVNYLTALLFAQPNFHDPPNIPSPPCFSQRVRNARPQQYRAPTYAPTPHSAQPQQYRAPPTHAPTQPQQYRAPPTQASTSYSAQPQQYRAPPTHATTPHSAQPQQYRAPPTQAPTQYSAQPQQYRAPPTQAPTPHSAQPQHSGPQMNMYHQEQDFTAYPPSQRQMPQQNASSTFPQSGHPQQSRHTKATPMPIKVASSDSTSASDHNFHQQNSHRKPMPRRNVRREEQNFSQLPNQPETPHAKALPTPQRNVSSSDRPRRKSMPRKAVGREDQNFSQLPNQPETPHTKALPRPQRNDLREQCNQNLRQLPNQPETPHFQSQTNLNVQKERKPHSPPQQTSLQQKETMEDDQINQFACWPPKEFLEDEEISDENVVESAAPDSINVMSLNQSMVMTEEDEETLQMMEKISMMNSSDFIRNDTVMDPEVAKFFLMGEIRRNRMKKKEEERKTAQVYSIKGKAELMEEENNKMDDLYGEYKMYVQSRKFANDSAFRKYQKENRLEVWPNVPLQI